jgi:hypothetical protein
MKWRDRREVLAISSEHTNNLFEVTNRKGEQKLKPMAISMYNKYMSGIRCYHIIHARKKQ